MLGKHGWRVLALVGALALLVVACSNDDDGASSDDGQDEAEVEVPMGPRVSGEAFKIGSIYSAGVAGGDNPDLDAGAQAGAEYVNQELGGIGGRPVEIVSCNEELDPSVAATCAQEFVDEDVIGVVGLSAVWGDNGLPITAEAEIPFVGQPVSNAEFLTPTSHPFGGGSLTAFPALAKYATEELGVESASILYVDLAAGEVAANALLGDPLREAGVDVTIVPEAAGAADFTSAVVKANDGDPDIMFILFAAEDCGRIVQAAQQVGVSARLAGSGSCADPAALEVAGEDALEGFLLNSDTHYVAEEGEPEFEDAEIFRDRIVRYADQEPTSFAAGTFSQVVTLSEIADQVAEEQGADAVSGATVLAQILTLQDQPIFMGDALNANDPVELAGVQTGVFNPAQRIYEFTGGDFVDVGGEWIDGYE